VSVLVTGGTGFLGSAVVRHLVHQQGMQPVVFDRYPDADRIAEVADRCTLVAGDVLEPYELLSAMRAYGVDRVVHLAFAVGGPLPDHLLPYARLMTLGTANVFEAARITGVGRVVNASSVDVYGPSPAPVCEDDPKRPDSLYGVSKLWTEQLAHEYNRSSALEVISLRFGAVYGFGRDRRGSFASGYVRPFRHWLALVEPAARGEPVTLPSGDRVADFCYTDDLAEAVLLALTAEMPEHDVFNVRSDQQPVRAYVEAMQRVLPDARITMGDESVRVNTLMDNRRIRTELGFEPRYTIEDGLRDYVARIRQEADRAQRPSGA
jgi:UDP-glucose 4-epimerase